MKHADALEYERKQLEEHHKVTDQGNSRRPMGGDKVSFAYALTRFVPSIPRRLQSGTLSQPFPSCIYSRAVAVVVSAVAGLGLSEIDTTASCF